MDITCIFFGILFIVTGVLFFLGKVHVRLPEWKRMPETEKERINIVPLCRNIGEVILLCGIVFLMRGVIPDFAGQWFLCAMVAWMIVAGLDVWYISKSRRFQKK